MIAKKLFLIYLFVFITTSMHLSARFIESSSPYLAGDTFRAMCQYYFDEVDTSFNPSDVQPGDCIFVKTDMLDGFFERKHPHIQNPYIIISHNSDHPAPGPGIDYLNDPKIVAWFAQNVMLEHPKLHPIPIGIANRMWDHGNVAILEHCQKRAGSVPRRTLAYMNFSIGNYPQARQKAYDYFCRKEYCVVSGRTYNNSKSWEGYLLDLLETHFVISPRGNGLDCLRTWEALYMGAFPIVQKSAMDAVFKNLPVIIINDWNEITEELLQIKYQEFSQKKSSMKKLYAPFWERKIAKYKKIAKNARR